MTSDPECLFRRLIGRDGDVSVVHEDERTTTIMDIQPVQTGHVLVLPRAHVPRLADLDREDGAQMFRIASCGGCESASIGPAV